VAEQGFPTLAAIDLGTHLGLLDIPPQFDLGRWKIKPSYVISVSYFGYILDVAIVAKPFRIIGPIVFLWSHRLQRFDQYTLEKES